MVQASFYSDAVECLISTVMQEILVRSSAVTKALSIFSPVTSGAQRKITHPMARNTPVSKIDSWNVKSRFGDESKMEGEYVVMLGIIHPCTALRYKPAYKATW